MINQNKSVSRSGSKYTDRTKPNQPIIIRVIQAIPYSYLEFLVVSLIVIHIGYFVVAMEVRRLFLQIFNFSISWLKIFVILAFLYWLEYYSSGLEINDFLNYLKPFRVILCQEVGKPRWFYVYIYNLTKIFLKYFCTQLYDIKYLLRQAISQPLYGVKYSYLIRIMSGPWSNGNERVLRIPQSPNITGISLSDCLVSYLGHSLGTGSYPSAEVQSVYSTAPADWAMCYWCNHFCLKIVI